MSGERESNPRCAASVLRSAIKASPSRSFTSSVHFSGLNFAIDMRQPYQWTALATAHIRDSQQDRISTCRRSGARFEPRGRVERYRPTDVRHFL